MLTTLAFDNTEQSLYRQLLEPIAFTTRAVDSYTPSKLQEHIDLVHPGGNFKGKTSLAVTEDILQYQVSNGMSSDWVTPPPGSGYMADADLAPLFNLNLLVDYPGIGGAWHYFKPTTTTWVYVVYNTEAFKLSQFWVDEYSTFVTWYKPPGVSYLATDKVSLFNFNSANAENPQLSTGNLPSGFTEVVPGYYSSNPTFINTNSSSIRPVNNSTTRLYYLSADAVPVGSPGLFNEAEALANPTIAEALTHIVDTAVHISLDMSKVSNNAAYSGYYLRYALSPNFYLYNGMGGDGWIDASGNLQSPILDNPPVQHWIAYGANGGRVLDPDTQEVIAAPVNGKTEVRCMFTLPLGTMPVVEGDINLRCLNPDSGFTLLTDYLIPDP